ncbi:MAG TPA: hypothetical protein PKG81_05345, partial [Candidatus Omnitrophota bacterium]|nr:hypothetical protein [Candidatus Omnitrophota bacterium]
ATFNPRPTVELTPGDIHLSSPANPGIHKTKTSHKHLYIPGAIVLIFCLFLATLIIFKKNILSSNNLSGVPKQSSLSPISTGQKTSPLKPDTVPYTLATDKDKTSPNLSLTGIMYAQNTPKAVINGQSARENDTIDGFTVTKISADSVEGIRNGEKITLRMAE